MTLGKYQIMQQGFLKQDFSDRANNLKYGHKTLHSLLLGHFHILPFFLLVVSRDGMII